MREPPRIDGLRELERLTITVITDNYYDALRPNTAVSTRISVCSTEPR
jgi:hypothetical protein